MTHKLAALVLTAALLTAQTVFADDAVQPDGSLAPGKAAGIHAAEGGTDLNPVVIGAGIVLVGVAVYFIAGTHYHTHTQAAAGK